VSRNLHKPLLLGVTGLAVVLAAGYGFLRLTGLISPDVCVSDRGGTFTFSEATLEVVYTNCDTLAKDEAVRVYISRTSRSWFAMWLNRK
jgi:hypothetical protein